MPSLSAYPYSLIRRILNTRINGRLSNINVSGDTNIERDLINSAVRQTISDLDLRGTIREATLAPNIMENQYDYALPADVKADKIIDLRPQVTDSRGEFETYDPVTPAEFDRRKSFEKGIYTITNDDLTRVLRVAANVESEAIEIANFETINGDGDTWIGFAGTADTDVKTDGDNFVDGSGAVRFSDTAGASDTSIGIQNRGLTGVDLSSYMSRGSFFVYGRLDSGDTGIKSINLQIGTDSNNYYTLSDSNQNDCSAFVSGWNSLRLDASSKVATGTPTDTDLGSYVALYWGKDSGTHLDTDFGFDYLVAKKGKYYNISYYSSRVWQDTAYALVENSTHDSHALLLQNDELEVVLAKASELASQFLRDPNDTKYFREEYKRLKEAYQMTHPSQAGVLTSTRYDLASLDNSLRDS